MQKLFLIPAFLFLLVAVNSDAQLAQPGGAGTVNVGQINGVAPTMGNGVSGTGVPRVTLASDSTGQVTLATGASVIATQTTATSLKAEVVGPTADNAANPTAKLATLPAVALAAAPTRTEGNVVPLRTNLAGDVAITLDSEAVVLGAGSATIGALTANQSVNTAQIAGVAPSLNTGVRDAGTLRVTVATNDVVPASQSGTWTVQPGNTANTTAWKVDGSAVTQPVSGTVTATAGAGTSGGWTPYVLISAATNNSTSLKGSAGQVGHIQITNTSAGIRRVKFYDKATAPTCGTDTPVQVYEVPFASGNVGGHDIDVPIGTVYTLGIGFCIVTGQAHADNTAGAAGDVVLNIHYK